MIVVTVARRPLSEPNVAANVLKHGTGALHIEASRVTTTDDLNGGAYTIARQPRAMNPGGLGDRQVADCGPYTPPSGRWPANLIIGHLPGCVSMGVARVPSSSGVVLPHHRRNVPMGENGIYGYADLRGSTPTCYVAPDGTEAVEVWDCAPGCTVAAIDEQSGHLHARGNRTPTTGGGGMYGLPVIEKDSGPMDAGGASRFFRQVKP